jgi:hypothetical protein
MRRTLAGFAGLNLLTALVLGSHLCGAIFLASLLVLFVTRSEA